LRVKLKNVYRIEEKPLREGNTSVIYKGEDLGSRQQVAIRAIKQQNFFNPLLNKVSAEALENELSKLLGLKHRHLINILGAHLDAFPACYVEEFIQGPTLDRLLNLGAWPLSRVLPLMRQLGDALYYLHAKGVVHGRIRPFKVFLDHEGMATISPFDVINLRNKRWDLRSFQNELLYFSPEELLISGQEGTTRSDQFCLAVLAMTLLLGRPLFAPIETDSSLQGDLEGIYLSRKTFFSDQAYQEALVNKLNLPQGFREIILRMLDRDPKERFPSMKAMLDALEDLRLPRPSTHSLVQDSYHRACANHSRLIEAFYNQLFNAHPEIKAHFRRWEHTAGPRRPGALELIVRHAVQLLLVHDADPQFLETIRNMPAHAGVGKEQYESFIDCLIETIKGQDVLWDIDTAFAWKAVRAEALQRLAEA
ncbi:MAG: protein kinase, partial [Bacteroidota bacterium]